MTIELTNGYDEFLAEIYDAVFPKQDDLPFFAAIARQTGGPVLELACGTGRVLVSIAHDGLAADGFDISEPMLRVARRHLAKEPETVRNRIRLQHGDMLSTALPAETYNLAIVAFSSIYHLAGAEQRVRVYSKCLSTLTNKGLLVIDNNFFPARFARVPSAPLQQNHGNHVLPNGTKFTLDIRTQPPYPAMSYSRTLLLRSLDGSLIHEHTLEMEYVAPTDTFDELRLAGFREIEVFDGYSGSAVEVDKISVRQVFVAHV